MATIPVDIFANPAHNRFVTSATNASPPTLPTATQGDTWAVSLYWLDDAGSGFTYHRYATAVSALRFRAAGNSHVYAYGDNNSGSPVEIGPANENVAITRTQGGLRPQEGGPRPEIQRVKLPAVPQSGEYTLNFPGPTVVGAPSGITAPKGSVTIQVGWTITQIRDAIRQLPFYTVFNATLVDAPGFSQYLSLSGTPDDYSINYQDSGGTRPGPIELVSISANTLKYVYGWTFNLPLTDSDFADVFLNPNGPAYFEALIDGTTVAQKQLTAGGSGNTAPAFTSGPPPSSGTVGVGYSFAYTASGFPAPTFAVTSGALPSGLSLSSAGLISGTPTASGTFSGIVTATNAAGSATQAFSITVGTITLPGGPSIGVYYDGDFTTAQPIEQPRPERPFPWLAHSGMRQRYWQLREYKVLLPLGSACPYLGGAVLVEEGPATNIGGGIIEWERVWFQVPPGWTETEIVNYPYQQLYQAGGNYAVMSVMLSRKASVTHTFYNTTNPTTITANRLPRVSVANNVPIILDNFQNLNPGATTIACDDVIERWKGNIWHRIEKYITI